ncbi:M23 family metallopeptidase, partial [Saccharomonospora iraqiensis]|uniref:M23 family metallopeptidase n=1 Tax=Saccharomonospora iraqiensis TaxID=52698 RepID=UPI001F42A2FE
EAAAREELDAAVAAHERATGRAADAQQRVDDLGTAIQQTRNQLDKAAQRAEQYAGSEYRFGSLVGPVLGYLSADEDERAGTSLNVAGNSSADPTGDLTDRLEAQQDTEQAAQAKLKQTRNAEKKAANTLADAEQAHGATVADLDAAQARVDELAAEKAARTPGGAAAPAAGVVQPAQGEFTSGYGARWGSSHLGIDIANDIGTPIVAAHSGTVVSSGPASGFGLWVRVQRDDGLTTLYGHINESLVSVGQEVEAGQEIATLGNRGQSTGPHLHFGVVENGEKIDPQEWLGRFGLRY